MEAFLAVFPLGANAFCPCGIQDAGLSTCHGSWRTLHNLRAELKTHDPEQQRSYTLSAERLVACFPENLHHRLEGKPLRDLLATVQPAAELRARELGDFLALRFGLALLNVALLRPDVDHVLIVRHCHTQLRRVFLACLLRV